MKTDEKYEKEIKSHKDRLMSKKSSRMTKSKAEEHI